MLEQSATESNLDHLKSAADTEYGPPRQVEPFEQAELHLIAFAMTLPSMAFLLFLRVPDPPSPPPER